MSAIAYEPVQESIYRPVLCRLESVVELTPVQKHFRLVRLDGGPFIHHPGQFVQVSAFGVGEAPISVASSPTRPWHLDLGIRKVGAVTRAVHELVAGDEIGIRGPFGVGFDVDAMRGKDVVLIAGGCGLAPMRALVQYCEDRREEFGRVTLLFGAKTPQDLLYRDEFFRSARAGTLDCRCTVDRVPDGEAWEGSVGLITELVAPLPMVPGRTVAVMVGPPEMYRPVIAALRAKGLDAANIQLSLERNMKCGIGKCGHCIIEHLYCCLDGPVFRLSEIFDVPGAL